MVNNLRARGSTVFNLVPSPSLCYTLHFYRRLTANSSFLFPLHRHPLMVWNTLSLSTSSTRGVGHCILCDKMHWASKNINFFLTNGFFSNFLVCAIVWWLGKPVCIFLRCTKSTTVSMTNFLLKIFVIFFILQAKGQDKDVWNSPHYNI